MSANQAQIELEPFSILQSGSRTEGGREIRESVGGTRSGEGEMGKRGRDTKRERERERGIQSTRETTRQESYCRQQRGLMVRDNCLITHRYDGLYHSVAHITNSRALS